MARNGPDGGCAFTSLRLASKAQSDRSPCIGASRSLTGRPGDENMDALTPASTIHYFDTRLHRILCGLRGFEHRSTKHSRDVTCDACVGLLRQRPAIPAMDTSDTPTGSAPP